MTRSLTIVALAISVASVASMARAQEPPAMERIALELSDSGVGLLRARVTLRWPLGTEPRPSAWQVHAELDGRPLPPSGSHHRVTARPAPAQWHDLRLWVAPRARGGPRGPVVTRRFFMPPVVDLGTLRAGDGPRCVDVPFASFPPRRTWNVATIPTRGPLRLQIARHADRVCGAIPVWSPSWGRYVVVEGDTQVVRLERDPGWPLPVLVGTVLLVPLFVFGLVRGARRRRQRPRWLAVRRSPDVASLRDSARPPWDLYPLGSELALSTLGGALEGSVLTLHTVADGVRPSVAVVAWDPVEGAYHAAEGSHLPTGARIDGEGAPIAILSDIGAARVRAGAPLEAPSEAVVRVAREQSPIPYAGPTASLGGLAAVSFACGVAVGAAAIVPYALVGAGWIGAGATPVAVALGAAVGASIALLSASVIPLPARPRLDGATGR